MRSWPCAGMISHNARNAMPPLKWGQILTIMKFHPTLAALVFALSTTCPTAWSEVTSGQATDTAAGAAAAPGAGNWSAALEKPTADNGTADLSKDLSAEARILNDHLANFDKPGQIPDAKKPGDKTATMPGTAASGAKAAADAPADWGSEWANKIRDFFRPIHKEVANSDVVQAVRELESVIPKKRESDDTAAAPPPAAPLILEPVGPLTSEEQRRRDKLASSIAMEQLIDDIKPYGYGLLALMVLGYLGVVTWRFLSWKQGKSGKRIHRARVARRRRTRQSVASESADQSDPDGPKSRSGALTSRAAPLSSRAAPLASRAAPLQNESQNERLSP